VGFVFSFLVINFSDKAVIGLSTGPIMSEMALTNAQFGALGSAFFLLSAIFQGSPVDSLPTRSAPNHCCRRLFYWKDGRNLLPDSAMFWRRVELW
jgi:hypothetical protein